MLAARTMLVLAAALLAAAAGASAQALPPGTAAQLAVRPGGYGSLEEALIALNATTLLAAVGAANLTSVLSNSTNITLLAPGARARAAAC